MSLTDYDKQAIADARELAALPPGTAAIREHTGETETILAYVVGFSKAQGRLADLLAIIDRLAVDSG